jgi:MtN3 and saliva related transmembrane protein
MTFVSIVGFGAGTLCTLAYLPQALHSFRTKSVRDISLLMLVSLNVGLLLWVAYGFLIRSLPIILPNSVTFLLAFPLLILKLRHRHDRAADAVEQEHELPSVDTSARSGAQRNTLIASGRSQ